MATSDNNLHLITEEIELFTRQLSGPTTLLPRCFCLPDSENVLDHEVGSEGNVQRLTYFQEVARLNDGTTYWSSYRLAKELGISQSSVSRVWRHFGIQRHRVHGYKAMR